MNVMNEIEDITKMLFAHYKKPFTIHTKKRVVCLLIENLQRKMCDDIEHMKNNPTDQNHFDDMNNQISNLDELVVLGIRPSDNSKINDEVSENVFKSVCNIFSEKEDIRSTAAFLVYAALCSGV